MTDKKQEKNSANRQKDAQKRGQTEKSATRERNIGAREEHSRLDKGRDRAKRGAGERPGRQPYSIRLIASISISFYDQYMIIYYLRALNSTTCHWRSIVPIDLFNCQSDFDITLLHLTEHCCFGNEEYLEDLNKNSYRFGGYTPEGKLTKNSLEFSWSFFAIYFPQAIKYFKDFLDNIPTPLTHTDLKFYKKELEEELGGLGQEYKKLATVRRNIFAHPPYSFYSC